MSTAIENALSPWDAHNQQLAAHVHPADWQNPTPADRYHLVVIGAGTAGLVTAAGAAGLGAKVALVEKHLMGGDCLNVGCVPSKALLRAAHAVHQVQHAKEFGVLVSGEPTVDFAGVMERVRRVRSGISHHDSAQRFRDLGVDVFLGEAKFTTADTVAVGGQMLRFKNAVITTGARAAVPEIPGLKEAGFLTNETVFNLTELPRRLVVLGGGPIGCELAQAFQRLGSQVTLLQRHTRLLPHDDEAAAAIVQAALLLAGVQVVPEATVQQVERTDTGKRLTYLHAGKTSSVEADAILVATGRQPNVLGLGLETVNVAYDARQGVQVNDFLQTTNPRIYAAGDVCLPDKFTHAADFAARIVIQNALFLGRKRLSALTIPHCTYTGPELAQVGLTELAAKQRGLRARTFTQSFASLDRALTDGATQGFVKIIIANNSDQILGATIVGPHAGELISEISVAMAGNVGLGQLASVIHPYPTLAEAIRKCGDAYNRTRLTPTVKSLFQKWLTWTR
jgi:pyruvate/2-oxoglutarate dehydrogenase complex dihydrolipoamide dehydrogenase (E3) component